MSDNIFKEFPYETLQNMKTLETIDISRNRITKIADNKDFTKFERLRVIDLSANGMTEFPGPIKDCLRLKELRLIHNRIREVPDSFYTS